MNGIKYRFADEMKDSGIEWIGKIPREWTTKRIKTIGEVKNGATPQSTNEMYWDGNIEWFTPTDMVYLDLLSSKRKLTKRGLMSCGTQLVSKDSILISCRAPIGKLGIIRSVLSTFNQGCKSITVRSEDYKYSYYCIASSVDQLVALGKGTTFMELSGPDLSNFKIPCPDILVQRKIANFLDIKTAQFDSIIAKKEQLIAKLEEAKKSLISEVVTGKVKIVDGQLVPRQPEEMKDSGVEWLGMIPKEWSAKKIKYIKSSKRNSFVDGPFGSNLKSEHYVDDGDVYIVESGFITTGEFLNRDYKTITISHFNTIKRSSCTEGDIVIAKIGANFGMSGILPKLDKPSVVSGNSLKLTVSEQYSNKYIQYSLLALRFQGVIHFIVNGSAQPALTLGSLNELKMCAPPIIEQLEIVEISNHKLGIINNQINKNLYQLALLKSAKQSLISEAVTGKIDLRDWEIIEQGGAS